MYMYSALQKQKQIDIQCAGKQGRF